MPALTFTYRSKIEFHAALHNISARVATLGRNPRGVRHEQIDQSTSKSAHGMIRQLRPSDLPRTSAAHSTIEAGETASTAALTRLSRSLCAALRARHDVSAMSKATRCRGRRTARTRRRCEPTGEIAFSVERDLQHRGIGGRLFQRLIAKARGLGYLRLQVTTHSNNGAMKALARRFNAELSFQQAKPKASSTWPARPTSMPIGAHPPTSAGVAPARPYPPEACLGVV